MIDENPARLLTSDGLAPTLALMALGEGALSLVQRCSMRVTTLRIGRVCARRRCRHLSQETPRRGSRQWVLVVIKLLARRFMLARFFGADSSLSGQRTQWVAG